MERLCFVPIGTPNSGAFKKSYRVSIKPEKPGVRVRNETLSVPHILRIKTLFCVLKENGRDEGSAYFS